MIGTNGFSLSFLIKSTIICVILALHQLPRKLNFKTVSNRGDFSVVAFSAYEDDPDIMSDLKHEDIKNFKEYCSRGLQRFQDRDIRGALDDLQTAAQFNSTQPLVQLGIILYLVNEYEDAAKRLAKDIKTIEDSRFAKATELRLWRCACLNKLGRHKEAIDALDHTLTSSTGLYEERYLFNQTLLFYAHEKSLEDMLEIFGSCDGLDTLGRSFLGNFFLGLYYDSVGESGLAQAFLSIPKESARYSSRDMWYHLPRVFYDLRYPDSDDRGVNSAGMII